MVHIDLFSGIGGFALAADWVWPGITHVFCEIEPFPQKILKKHWPDAEIYGDIKKLDGKEIVKKYGAIDILTGGFPCQPFSVAGKRGGQADDRYLWPEMFRVIKESRPRWIIAENVPGIINLALDQVCDDLEGIGYETGTQGIPASALEAWHIREREWIGAYDESRVEGKHPGIEKIRQIQQFGIGFIQADVADSHNGNCRQGSNFEQEGNEFNCNCKIISHSDQQGLPGATCDKFASISKKEIEFAGGEPGRIAAKAGEYWAVEPFVGRVANGIPNRVDRLKCLGNAIVPQVAAVIMGFIKQIDVD
jgi:DNA (cytosine-5)-methyltransferase 1